MNPLIEMIAKSSMRQKMEKLYLKITQPYSDKIENSVLWDAGVLQMPLGNIDCYVTSTEIQLEHFYPLGKYERDLKGYGLGIVSYNALLETLIHTHQNTQSFLQKNITACTQTRNDLEEMFTRLELSLEEPSSIQTHREKVAQIIDALEMKYDILTQPSIKVEILDF